MQLLIFDLDGTLIDSALDLAISVNATRRHMGLAEMDLALIASYVGDGAPVLIRRVMGPNAPRRRYGPRWSSFLAFTGPTHWNTPSCTRASASRWRSYISAERS